MKRVGLVALVATLGFVVAAPAEASTPLSAHARIAKKCKRKHGKKRCHKTVPAPVVTPPPSGPPALTAAEVINQVVLKANQYCAADSDCVDYGFYASDPSLQYPQCSSRGTWSWSCYGWNYEYWPGDDPDTDYWWCDFREIVERSVPTGVMSHQDVTFGGSPWASGWDCYPDIP